MELLFISWFTFTFWMLRGVTEGDDVKTFFPKILAFLTGKYLFSLYAALFLLTFKDFSGIIELSAFLGTMTLVWALSVARKAEFTLLHTQSRKAYWFKQALNRSIHFLIPFGALIWFFSPDNMWLATIVSLLGATSYAWTQSLLNPFYHERFFGAEALHQILTGFFMSCAVVAVTLL